MDQTLSIVSEFDAILKLAYPEDIDLKKVKESVASFPLHERRSLFILNELHKKGIFSFQNANSQYRSLIYKMAFLILFSSVQSDQKLGTENNKNHSDFLDNSAFRFLKLIIAGSIDGDRMDYTIRDGHSCGSHIGRFDLTGITDYATLFREKEAKDFRIGYFYRAIPAIEQFFSQRHQGYKYLIYHRTSARTETCLQNLILELLEFCFRYPDDEISKYFEQLGYFAKDRNGIHKIFPIFLEAEMDAAPQNEERQQVPFLDDANLRSFLNWTLRNILKRKAGAEKDMSNRFYRIDLLLKIVLKRKFQHIHDPFKDSSLLRCARQALRDVAKENELSNEKTEQLVADAQKLFAHNSVHRLEVLDSIEKCMESGLDNKVLFFYNVQKPKIYNHELAAQKGEEVHIIYEEVHIIYNGVNKNGYVPTRPIISASITLKSMPEIFVDEFRVRFYFVANCIKMNEKIIDDINELMKTAIYDAAKNVFEHLTNGK